MCPEKGNKAGEGIGTQILRELGLFNLEKEAQGRPHHSLQLPEKWLQPGGVGLCSLQPLTEREDTALSCARGSSGWTSGKNSSLKE